ncbi:MAG TPA: hypothetical protein VJB57_05920 [Dehalococcoidia bacterium]|nr:hypothetical protein [Dehalococcoidia bacterium]
MDHIYPGQKRDTVVLARHEARWKADTQRFIDEPQKVIQEATESLASEMAEQMERELFAKLRTADSGAGGFFTGSSDDELVRNALDTLRKMDISFDEDGKPSIFVAISPEATELLAALQDPSVREEVDSILKEKYREWLYREAHRRLVD